MASPRRAARGRCGAAAAPQPREAAPGRAWGGSDRPRFHRPRSEPAPLRSGPAPPAPSDPPPLLPAPPEVSQPSPALPRPPPPPLSPVPPAVPRPLRVRPFLLLLIPFAASTSASWRRSLSGNLLFFMVIFEVVLFVIFNFFSPHSSSRRWPG